MISPPRRATAYPDRDVDCPEAMEPRALGSGEERPADRSRRAIFPQTACAPVFLDGPLEPRNPAQQYLSSRPPAAL